RMARVCDVLSVAFPEQRGGTRLKSGLINVSMKIVNVSLKIINVSINFINVSPKIINVSTKTGGSAYSEPPVFTYSFGRKQRQFFQIKNVVPRRGVTFGKHGGAGNDFRAGLCDKCLK